MGCMRDVDRVCRAVHLCRSDPVRLSGTVFHIRIRYMAGDNDVSTFGRQPFMVETYGHDTRQTDRLLPGVPSRQILTVQTRGNPMSMVTHLNITDNGMSCECPSCGNSVDVFEADLHGTLMDGKNNDTKEYSVRCPDCDQSFYASTAYL